MEFSDYQAETRKTAQYPDRGANFVFPTLGMVGEAGEVAEKVKKLMRDHDTFSPAAVGAEVKTEIVKELGDVLWYLAQLATEFDVSLDEIAKQNLVKIKDRRARGKISGEGDNR